MVDGLDNGTGRLRWLPDLYRRDLRRDRRGSQRRPGDAAGLQQREDAVLLGNDADLGHAPELDFPGNVKRLSLFVRGRLTNGPATLYLALEDKAGHVGIVSYPDLTGVTTTWWQDWDVSLSSFSAAGVNPGAVKKMYLGVGSRTNPAQGGAGRLYIDDIRLIRQ